jgi:hypothetical protein|tara:strand:+ start:2457 stop:3068 length:612 start_codon:yes stop_codon:yes gene_type:complete
MKSLSEIDTVSKRASRASGFDWGIAEEVGKNTRMLEMLGIPGIKNLNYYYKIRTKKNFEKINLINKENKTSHLEYCPIIAGVSFLDQVRSLENLNIIKFQKLAFPILFLPFVSRASEVVGKKILLKIDSRNFLLNYNNSIYSNSLDSGILTIGNDIQITFQQNRDSFEENEWKELYKLSENTFVEENDSLKQSGAGAGLTDND